MSKDIKHRLSRLHEADIASWFDGTQHVGSGNQYHHQGDGRTGYHGEWDFRWDCKAAMPGTQSITVTRAMIDKLIEQCHGARPMLPMRFYDNERGGFNPNHDLVVLRADDAIALVEFADGVR